MSPQSSGAPLPAGLVENRIVPVVVVAEESHSEIIGEALATGGLPVAEVTFRTAAAPYAIKNLSSRGDLIVGAGTVITPAQVDQAAEAGAQFIVSPGTSVSVIERCSELGLPVIPGAVTASEIMTLLDLGLDLVKFFPAGTSGGAAAIKALSAPFPHVQFVPTGGVSTGNIGEYLSLSCIPAVGGSWMLPSNLISNGDVAAVADLCRQAVKAAKEIKK